MKPYVPKKTIEVKKIDALSKVLQQYYDKDMLLAFFRVFLRQFILDNEAVCRQYGVPVTGIRKPQPSKSELTDTLKAIFGNGELFRSMLAALLTSFRARWASISSHTDAFVHSVGPVSTVQVRK